MNSNPVPKQRSIPVRPLQPLLPLPPQNKVRWPEKSRLQATELISELLKQIVAEELEQNRIPYEQ
jgi:hypothetical protein